MPMTSATIKAKKYRRVSHNMIVLFDITINSLKSINEQYGNSLKRPKLISRGLGVASDSRPLHASWNTLSVL